MNSQQKQYQDWVRSQRIERSYYNSRAKNLTTTLKKKVPYVEIRRNYWHKLLDLIAKEVEFTPEKVIADVGCGPSPIVAFIKARRKIAIDPLIDHYQKQFILPSGIEYHQGKMEDLKSIEDQSLDIVFAMNCIDQIENIRLASQTLARKIKPTGHLIITVNLTQNKLLYKLSLHAWINRILDPVHPHHFHTSDDLIEPFRSGFEIVAVQEIQNFVASFFKEKDQHDRKSSFLHTIKKSLKRIRQKTIGFRRSRHVFVFKRKAQL